ncbi:uncharacterized protein CC84DRAFT_1220497 [Paraphaeosphaeria sporulosa]|uniref:Uncharacterized protein n=1 Tax=Paraphaeosphaeria sporulosa TaxID=1460663 RepID=A0A177C5H4_9PLEO|nr:uncharacterized protein CC84DRAFT_1220497 [Paraphaeosphaeria sporulosa]OAG02139.1 hypothetical protein CC84DRAFT_1220497 [Paraphaeosphaeria sporulosa]
MKPKSSSRCATWSFLFLSLYAAAGLCTPTAGPLLQPGAPSPAPARHPAPPGRQAQSSPSQLLRDQAQAQDAARSPSGLASRSPQPQPQPQVDPLPSSSERQSKSRARRRSAASRRANTGVCTFTVSQVQVCTPDSTSPALANYLQINTLYSPYNADAAEVDNVRHQRPMQEFNSYQRLLADQPWDVARVEGDSRTLTIIEGEDGDLRMSYGGAGWTEDSRAGDGQAGWCEEAEWYEAEDWSCPHGDTKTQRKRTIHCGFPCARIERLELK